MVDVDTAMEWSSRCEHVQKYLRCYMRSLQADWLELYRTHPGDWVMRLALIHPEHYSDYCTDSNELDPRGDSQFRVSDDQRAYEQCQSEVLWGYACPISALEDGVVQADHVFPWSFGGPTVPSNMRWLCRAHNGMKSNDLHIFPWEAGEPTWLGQQLEKVHMIIRRINAVGG